MKLWIRSQDKERLTLTGDLRIDYCVENGMYAIDSCDYIGFYKTEERALEVLDEIQNLLSPKVRLNCILSSKEVKKYQREFIPNTVIVYEMPKE